MISARPRLAAFGIVLAVLAAAGCHRAEDTGAPAPVPPGWRAALERDRKTDQAFMRSENSPLKPEARASFPGLRFFPPDSTWRFTVRLDPRGRGQAAPILDNKGAIRHYRVEGKFSLRREGTSFHLTLYRSADDGTFFLPFQDTTSGVETYGAGRYLEVERDDGGRFILDFNRAYNPYCAYDDRWACPLVPPENAVPVAIRAGVMASPH